MQKSEAIQTSGNPAGAVRDMCTLSNDQLTSRLAEMRRDILPHIRKTHTLEDGLVLEFRDTPNLKAKVERLVALEQECCAGLRFELQEKPQPEGLKLEIRGIDPQSGTFEQLLAGIENNAQAPSQGSRLRRILSSTGIGVAGAFVVFRLLPIGLAALLGASATAYVAKLDNPLLLSVGAIVFGAAAWWFQKRRSTAQSEGSGRGGCGC